MRGRTFTNSCPSIVPERKGASCPPGRRPLLSLTPKMAGPPDQGASVFLGLGALDHSVEQRRFLRRAYLLKAFQEGRLPSYALEPPMTVKEGGAEMSWS